MIVMTSRRQRLMKCFQNGALGSSAFLPSIDADLQRFFNEYFVDTDSNDDDVKFEGFTPDDIHERSVYLINLCRDSQIAKVGRGTFK